MMRRLISSWITFVFSVGFAVWLGTVTTLATELDRLRVTITSSSDWTTLRLTGAEFLASWKASVLSGAATFGASHESLSVFQSLADANAGKSVTVQFDAVLQSQSPAVIGFESTKGSLGKAQISFYNFNSDTPALVAVITNAVTIAHPNRKAFSLGASALLAGEVSFARPEVQKAVLAFYYPWYGFDSWADPAMVDQPLAPYASDLKPVITRHVHEARKSGIDGFISSWWGPGSGTDANLKTLLQVADEWDFLVSIYFETLTGDPPHARPESEILAWLRYWLDAYGQHDCLLRFNGKPVVFIWAAASAPAAMWARVFAALESEGRHALYIANTLNPDYLEAFDGLHDYGPAFRANLGADFQRASTAARTFGWLDNKPLLKFWAATAQPGYDDREIPGRAGALIERNNGAAYARTWTNSINSTPDWVLITSFNEWWENTHIEPSTNYHDLYLSLTARYADLFKGSAPRPPARFEAPVVSDRAGRVRLAWAKPFGQEPDAYNLYRSSVPFTSLQGLAPIQAALKTTEFTDAPPGEGVYYYAVSPVTSGREGPLSEVLNVNAGGAKARSDSARPVPVDIALYVESTSWISSPTARSHANSIIQRLAGKVGRVEIVTATRLPDWIMSHTGNGQLDMLVTFGDIPESVYSIQHQQADRSLAKAFVDGGNFVLNTADYAFYGRGRNGAGGLMCMLGIPSTMWGDATSVRATPDAARFTPALRDFITDRPFHLADLAGSDWQVELALADNGAGLANPAVVYNRKTGGRIGIVYQKADDSLPRAQVISELILNWLEGIAKVVLANPQKTEAAFAVTVTGGGGHFYRLQGSTDTATWLDVSDVYGVMPPLVMTDTNAPPAHQFYRVLAW